MDLPGWLRTYALDAAYLGVGMAAVLSSPAETLLGIATVGFAVVVLAADWVELRVRLSDRKQTGIVLALATLSILAVWTALPVVADSNLRLYFALAGGVFFLQAGREVATFGRGPIELLRHGYPNLIGVCLVCSALADPLIKFRSTLLALVAFTFVVRKAFVWNGLFDAS
jgi:hypothetical protein